MNLSPGWIPFLREAGIEAVHWADVGRPDAADRQLMRWAVERDYFLVTADLDFGAILAASGDRGPSVFQIRSESLSPAVIGDAVIAALRKAKLELLDGAIVSMEAARLRLRILPLRR